MLSEIRVAVCGKLPTACKARRRAVLQPVQILTGPDLNPDFMLSDIKISPIIRNNLSRVSAI